MTILKPSNNNNNNNSYNNHNPYLIPLIDPITKEYKTMEVLNAEQEQLENYKEYLLLQIEEVSAEMEDLPIEKEPSLRTIRDHLQIARQGLQVDHMQVICDLARLQVQKEIVRTLQLKGLAEEVCLQIAKHT
jgi:hypothetical protein